MKATMSTDGSTYPRNPGMISAGVCIVDDSDMVRSFQTIKKIKHGTNSEAEYLALIRGMQLAKELGVTDLHCIVDSQFMYKQIIGANEVRKAHLKKYKYMVLEMVELFDGFEITWQSRESDMGVMADAASKWIYAPVRGKKFWEAKKLVQLELKKREYLQRRSHSPRVAVNQ